MRLTFPIPKKVRARQTLFLGILAVCLPATRAQDTALQGVADLRKIVPLAGLNSLNQTDTRWNVAGTDLGHMFHMGDTLYMVFGDTFGQGFVPPPGAGPAPDWRSNVMAVITDREPVDGLTFDRMIVSSPGNAKELISPRRDEGEYTIIPTNGIAVTPRMFLHYMSVREWGTAGKWTLTHSGLASSDDGGQNWSRLPWSWPGDSNFGQVAFVRDGSLVYLFGIPGGRFGPVKLARVSELLMTNKDAYRYYAGSSLGWVEDPAQAVEVVPAPVGELSVMWNNYLQRWIMTYIHNANIVIREAPALTGPWSAPMVLVPASQYPGLYAPYMHPWLVERDGEILYFTMSEWRYYHVALMRVRLIRKPLPLNRADVVRALQVAGGLAKLTPEDQARFQSGSAAVNLRFSELLARYIASQN